MRLSDDLVRLRPRLCENTNVCLTLIKICSNQGA